MKSNLSIFPFVNCALVPYLRNHCLIKGHEDICLFSSGLKLNIQKTKIMASGPITSWQVDEDTIKTMADFIFVGDPKSLQMVISAMKLKDTCSLEEKL